MKKLILSTAVLMFVGLTTFAQEASKDKKSCCKGADMKACCKTEKCDKACMDKCKAEGKACATDGKSCAKACAEAKANKEVKEEKKTN